LSGLSCPAGGPLSLPDGPDRRHEADPLGAARFREEPGRGKHLHFGRATPVELEFEQVEPSEVTAPASRHPGQSRDPG